MGFTLPGFLTLSTKTKRLGADYSRFLGRFILPSNDANNAASSSSPKNTLEVILERVQIVINCPTGRDSQRKVISKLATQLESHKKGTPEEIKKATFLMLGALIHRLKRLDYEIQIPRAVLSFFYDYPGPQLGIALEEALGINKANKLDDVTIVNALEVFRANMTAEIDVEEVKNGVTTTTKKPRYTTYEHLAIDTKFLIHLDDIIARHKELGKEALRQFKAISFLQSLATQLDNDQRMIEEELKGWSAALAKDHKDFTKLDRNLIESHLNTYLKATDKTRIKEIILMLLDTEYIAKLDLKSLSNAQFLDEMKVCNTNTNSYILYGAYVLLFQYRGLNEDLKTLMKGALNLSDLLSIEEKFSGIQFLYEYIQNEPKAYLNYEFFNGRNNLMTQLLQLKVSLDQGKEMVLAQKDDDQATSGNSFTAAAMC